MSKFVEFYQKIQSDEATKTAFIKVAEENGIKAGTSFADLTDAQINALIPVAKGAGFDFTLNELKDYFNEKKDGSLSDDELEMVAGGTGKPGGDPYMNPCPAGVVLPEIKIDINS